ncbi:MAG TPA: 3-dehydroquinate dehydratase, partial [Oceanospirillaceae bacterium]|nr:3-dehydroquinate dehydratase [Oceanospirillaceae bacterium]
MNIYVINGPNINLLGTREPEIYGKDTLNSITKTCNDKASKAGHSLHFMQSNYEG